MSVFYETHRVLGVIIDNNLEWQEHISKVCSKVSRNLFLLKKLKWYVNADNRRKFFFAHCMSHINYASSVWSNAADCHIKRLNSLHRRGAKLICDDVDLPTTKKLQKLKMLPLQEHLKSNIAILTFKTRKKLSPTYLDSFLLKPTTRYKSLRYRVPKGLVIYETSFSNAGSTVWNDLPTSLKLSNSLKSFKSLLLKHLVLNAYDNL